MELQDEAKSELTAFEAHELCTNIRPASAFSGSDDDNGDAPPFSFSIHGEHHLTPEQRDNNDNLNSFQIATESIDPNEDAVSEPEDDEQPPVTWFVTKPNAQDHGIYTQPYLLQYNGFDMAAQESQLCKLCLVRRKRFYCVNCVSKGEFSHSNPCRPGNLAEKKEQRSVIEGKTKVMVTEIKKKTSSKVHHQQLEEDIKMCRQRNKYLQILIQGTREKKDKTQKHAKKLGAMNETREQRLPLFIDKVSKICQYTSKYISELDREKLKVTEKYRSLDIVRRNHIRKLFELVFPVEKVVINSVSNSTISTTSKWSSLTASNDETAAIESLMADAMSTSYVHGQGWVTLSSDAHGTHSNSSALDESAHVNEQVRPNQVDRVVYKIVAPYLPADGDYSRFPAMVIAANDQVQSIIPSKSPEYQNTPFPTEFIYTRQSVGCDSSTEDDISPIHTISAGLTVNNFLKSIYNNYRVRPTYRSSDPRPFFVITSK